MAKILKHRQLNKSVCPPVVQGCVCEQVSDKRSISFTLDCNNPRAVYFCAWNLGDECLVIERYCECPADWKPLLDSCCCPLRLSDCKSDYMFILPGHYWIRTESGEPFPDDFAYEKMVVTREVASLYFESKKANCGGCGCE